MNRLNPFFWLLLIILLFAYPLSGQVLSGYHLEDFEGDQFPPPGWRTANARGTASWVRTNASAYNRKRSAFIKYEAGGGEDWLISPQFLVANGDSIVFYLSKSFPMPAPPFFLVYISTTDSILSSFTLNLLSLELGTDAPTANTWYRFGVSLSSYAGREIFIGLCHIDNTTPNTVLGGTNGTYIDKVWIGKQPLADASVSSFDSDPVAAKYKAYTPRATVQNLGQTAQSFDVTVELPGGYQSTTNTGPMVPKSTIQLAFDPYIGDTTGTHSGRAFTRLTGDTYNANDTIQFDLNLIDTFVHYGWQAAEPFPREIMYPKTVYMQRCMNGTDTGFLYAFGGGDFNHQFLNTAYRYNTVSKKWDTIAPLPQARTSCEAAVVKDKIYIAGGSAYTAQQNIQPISYDPATDQWSPVANIHIPVAGYAAGSYGDSLLYIVGGANGTQTVNNVQVYNVNTNTWHQATPVPGSPRFSMGMGLSGNIIIITGGMTASSTETELKESWKGVIDPENPLNIQWTRIADYPAGTVVRVASGTFPFNHGKVYFSGGNADVTISHLRDGTFAYNFYTDEWEAGPAKPTATPYISNLVGFQQNDSLYLGCMGGYSGGQSLNLFERINIGRYNDKGIRVPPDTVVCDKEVVLFALGGVSYAWSPGHLFRDSTAANTTVHVDSHLQVTVTSTPFWGCTQITDTINIQRRERPSVATAMNAAASSLCEASATVHIQRGGTSFSYLWDDPMQQRTATATGLCPGLYTCTITNEWNCNQIVEISIPESETGLTELGREEQISLYPNPGRSEIKVTASSKIESVLILDVQGQRVTSLRPNTNSIHVDINSLQTGIYLAIITTSTETKALRFSKL